MTTSPPSNASPTLCPMLMATATGTGLAAPAAPVTSPADSPRAKGTAGCGMMTSAWDGVETRDVGKGAIVRQRKDVTRCHHHVGRCSYLGLLSRPLSGPLSRPLSRPLSKPRSKPHGADSRTHARTHFYLVREEEPRDERVVHERLQHRHEAVAVVPQHAHHTFAVQAVWPGDAQVPHAVGHHPGQAERHNLGEIFALRVVWEVETKIEPQGVGVMCVREVGVCGM